LLNFFALGNWYQGQLKNKKNKKNNSNSNNNNENRDVYSGYEIKDYFLLKYCYRHLHRSYILKFLCFQIHQSKFHQVYVMILLRNVCVKWKMSLVSGTLCPLTPWPVALHLDPSGGRIPHPHIGSRYHAHHVPLLNSYISQCAVDTASRNSRDLSWLSREKRLAPMGMRSLAAGQQLQRNWLRLQRMAWPTRYNA